MRSTVWPTLIQKIRTLNGSGGIEGGIDDVVRHEAFRGDDLHHINAEMCKNLVRIPSPARSAATTGASTVARTNGRSESLGVLRFPSLNLASEDQHNEDQYHIDGDFKLNLEVESLNIVANGLSKFYLSGSATNASFGLYAGDCRIFSEDLIVQKLTVYHRSTGPMVVNPQQSIKGKIVSLGNVISKNRPPIVEVEELYRGKLIFE